jgi:hypothetical protein
VLLLCKGSADRADKYFDTVLDGNAANAPALLGKVLCATNQPTSVVTVIVCFLFIYNDLYLLLL